MIGRFGRKVDVERLLIPGPNKEHRSNDPEATAQWRMADMWDAKIEEVMDNFPLKARYLEHRNIHIGQATAIEAVLAWERLKAALDENDKSGVCAALPYALSWAKELAFYHTPGIDTGDLVKNLRRVVDEVRHFYRLNKDNLEFYCQDV